MKICTSLSYIGLRVSALASDYDAYLDLNLVCECCLQPVFWKKKRQVDTHQRVYSNGTVKTIAGYVAKSHFAHFSEADSHNCELRRASSSSQQLKQNLAQTRAQSLAKFVGKIDQIFQLNPRVRDSNSAMTLSLYQRMFERENRSKKLEQHLRVASNYISQHKYSIEQQIEVLCINEDPNPYQVEHLDYLKNSEVEQKLHSELSHKIVGYLCSGTDYQLKAKLYQIAVIDSLLPEECIKTINNKYGLRSPEYQNARVYITQAVASKGIWELDFEQVGLSEWTNILYIENSLNNIYKQASILNFREDLFIACFAGLIASTPWRKGFEISNNTSPKTITSKNIRLDKEILSCCYAYSPQYNQGAYYLASPRKGKISTTGNNKAKPVYTDFKVWLERLLKSVDIQPDSKTIEISQQLPNLNYLKLQAQITIGENANEIVCFRLSDLQNRSLSRMDYWDRLSKHNVKKILKQYRVKDPMIFNTPTIFITERRNIDYEKILLSIVNCFILHLD